MTKPIELTKEECQTLHEHMMHSTNPFEGKDEKTADVLRKIAVCAGEDEESVGVVSRIDRSPR